MPNRKWQKSAGGSYRFSFNGKEDDTEWGAQDYGMRIYDKSIANQMLADYVVADHIEGEPITLIGYSHGGNVSLQAAPLIYERLKQKVNIITINTPTSNQAPLTLQSEIPGAYSIIVEPPRWSENPDNPKVREAVNSHYHFYVDAWDMSVMGSSILEGSSTTYDSSNVNQIKTESPPGYDPRKNHGNIYYDSLMKRSFENSNQPRQSSPTNQ